MFTGIIKSLGRVARNTGGLLRICGPFTTKAKIGDSVAIDGVCLTITRLKGPAKARVMDFDVSAETLQKTTLGNLPAGQKVNLETPLRAGEPFGGHFVLGHVDGTGKIVAKTPQDSSTTVFEFSVPLRLQKYLVPKGSVAVDGVSLTVVEVGEHSFTVAVVPQTQKRTTLGFKKPGDSVNLEADILSKHVEKLLRGAEEEPSGELFVKRPVSWNQIMREEGYK